jgi:asparagine synthase (glutamine-hydrolysing)
MPAHCLSWPLAGGTPKIRRYWDIPSPRPDETSSVDELTDELQRLLTAAVDEQLVADVPVAVLLSGGVDSSLVAAIAAKSSRHRVRTFTVTLPNDPRLDESRFARSVAQYLGTDHVELPLDQSSADLIQRLAVQFDEPIADSSMIPTYLLAKTVSQHCKVVVGGDGGDELFGGYLSYQTVLRRNQLRASLPGSARSLIAATARRILPSGTKGRNALMALGGTTADGIAQYSVWTDAADYSRASPWLSRQSQKYSPTLWRRNLVEEDGCRF